MSEESFGFPPTYKLIIKHFMPAGTLRVLDLGCGTGVAGEMLNRDKKHQFVGVDIYKPYVDLCKKGGFYSKVERKDLTKIKLKKGSFDVILLLQVIEHLKKKEGTALLEECIRAVTKAVIVAVPNGSCHQEEYDSNTHQEHKSSWNSRDLNKMGFRVFGQGLKVIYGSKSYGGGRPASFWQKIVVPLSTFLLPLILFFPQASVQLIAVKYKNEDT